MLTVKWNSLLDGTSKIFQVEEVLFEPVEVDEKHDGMMVFFPKTTHPPFTEGEVFVMNETGATVAKFKPFAWIKGQGPKIRK